MSQQPYESTTTYFVEIPELLQQRLFAHQQRNPDLDGDAIICCALDRYLSLEEATSTPTCVYCHSANLLPSREQTICGYCGLIQPTEPDCMVIPQDLFNELLVALEAWSKVAPENQVERCSHIKAWATEYAPSSPS
ncbi:MAG: hypothetical protein SFY66_19575 [Oculatellaceae cyanobacterium bins.114]|nr:hypothetical protein [Oculatellaceae cyanobacterium bins.114]